MARLDMTIDHGLNQEDALLRIKGLLGDVKIQFAHMITELSEEWNGSSGKFSFKAKGMAISGTLTVEGSVVKISSEELPFLVSLAKPRIEQMIRERANTLLA